MRKGFFGNRSVSGESRAEVKSRGWMKVMGDNNRERRRRERGRERGRGVGGREREREDDRDNRVSPVSESSQYSVSTVFLPVLHIWTG